MARTGQALATWGNPPARRTGSLGLRVLTSGERSDRAHRFWTGPNSNRGEEALNSAYVVPLVQMPSISSEITLTIFRMSSRADACIASATTRTAAVASLTAE
jgi:hypothetical protein